MQVPIINIKTGSNKILSLPCEPESDVPGDWSLLQ